MVYRHFILGCLAIVICGAICCVSASTSQTTPGYSIRARVAELRSLRNRRPLASPVSRIERNKTKRASSVPSNLGDLFKLFTDGENDVEIVDAKKPENTNADSPKKPEVPRFPSLYKPFSEFQADLDRVFDHINTGLEKVMESFHDLVHDDNVSHDKLFITNYDPRMFKDMIAKYDEEQAAKQRYLVELKEEKARQRSEQAKIARQKYAKTKTTTEKPKVLKP